MPAFHGNFFYILAHTDTLKLFIRLPCDQNAKKRVLKMLSYKQIHGNAFMQAWYKSGERFYFFGCTAATVIREIVDYFTFEIEIITLMGYSVCEFKSI